MVSSTRAAAILTLVAACGGQLDAPRPSATTTATSDASVPLDASVATCTLEAEVHLDCSDVGLGTRCTTPRSDCVCMTHRIYGGATWGCSDQALADGGPACPIALVDRCDDYEGAECRTRVGLCFCARGKWTCTDR